MSGHAKSVDLYAGFLTFGASMPEKPFVYDDDADEPKSEASKPIDKAARVEDAFGAWLDARPAKTSRYDAPDDGTYQSVAADGKAVTLDGKFSVDALRELLRLIDQEFGNDH